VLDAERARPRLGVYVSEEVAEEVLRAGELSLGGRRQDIAVLFSDLRGFTTYAEHLPPERIVAELNGYLDAMVQVVRAEGGVVDKYIGDSIMVVFGVPHSRPGDARRAIRAAARMHQALHEHNAERACRRLPALQHGIGIHYGAAVAGHIGTKDRSQYTVIGDTVNLASRLQSATKDEQVNTLISSDAARAAQAEGEGALPVLRSCGELRVRGRDSSLEVLTFDA
jgi:adenylate cyclase